MACIAANTGPDNFSENRKLIWTQPAAEIRQWAKRAIEPVGLLGQCYRIHGEDIDGDLVRGSEYLQPSHGCPQKPAQFYLRLVFRFLMRNYAWYHAMKLERLFCLNSERWTWRVWRWTAYLLPRLFVAVAVGYAALLGSGDLRALLRLLAQDGLLFAVTTTAFLVAAFLMGLSDVQRRVGRRAAALTVRSVVLLFIGVFQSGVLLAAAGVLLRWLAVPLDWRHGVLCAGAALLLAHVVQLFWREESIGDPL